MAETDAERADRLAERWIIYAMKWARRHCPRPLDGEQVAIDALDAAIRTNRHGPVLQSCHLDHHLRDQRSRAMRYARASKRAGAVPLAGGQADEIPAAGGDPMTVVVDRDECGRLLGLIGRDDDRELFIKLAEGWTASEIARERGISRQLLHWRLNEARGRIRAAIDAEA